MAHPYKHAKEKHQGHARVHKLYGGDVKAENKPLGYARGGKVKGHGKGHHTKINIVVAPKGGGADVPPPPMPGGPPPGAGAMPPPPMPPKAPMGPPPGGPMGGGMPGLGMKRGGKVPSGISSKENLKKWADYAGKNTRYERGGRVHITAGGATAVGRMQKAKAYGRNAKRGG